MCADPGKGGKKRPHKRQLALMGNNMLFRPLLSLHRRPEHASLWPFALESLFLDGLVRNFELEDSARVPFIQALYGSVMRSGSNAPLPLVRPHHAAQLSYLEPSSFAFVSIDARGHQGEIYGDPFPLPYCLVQLPAVFPFDFDHEDPRGILNVSWWKPEETKADGKWSVWFNGKKQWTEDIQRGSIAVANVGLRAGSNNRTKPIGQRWVRVSRDSLSLLPVFK